MRYLDQELESYKSRAVYPFHMPGHKRNPAIFDEGKDPGYEGVYGIDITEIGGFDDLHDANGIIRELEEGFAKIYGAKITHLSVNGSTCGIMASVFSTTVEGDLVIAQRRSHKSFFHTAMLRGLNVMYVYQDHAKDDISEDMIRMMDENPGAKLIYLTSPDYEGYVQDVGRISEEAHKRGMKVIVDAAHGAHLRFYPGNIPFPLEQGADIVITSLHKMLPALTQTALILENDPRTDDGLIGYYLDCFESSSPSYVLMASCARCLRYLQEKGREDFLRYGKMLEDFYSLNERMSVLFLATSKAHDPCHIFIGGADGIWLAKELRKRYDIETEMSLPTGVLALSSVADTKDAFLQLERALMELDGEAGVHPCKDDPYQRFAKLVVPVACSAKRAMEHRELIDLEESVGRVAAEEIMVYPPGIPLLIPGEMITERMIDVIGTAYDDGLSLKGLKDRKIRVSADI